MVGLEFAPAGTMYGVSQSGEVYTINTSSGQTQLLFNTGLSIEGDIAHLAGSVFYATGGSGTSSHLFALDIVLQTSTDLGVIAQNVEFPGLDFDLSGRLVAGGTTGVIYYIPDLTTGTGLLLSNVGFVCAGLTSICSGEFITYCFCDGSGTPAPCNNTGEYGNGCANSMSSDGANLCAMGTVSVAADDLILMAKGARPSQPGLYFCAMNAINGGVGLQFGDGLRCAGGSVVRLGVVTSDSAGDSSFGPGIATSTGALAGDVRRYQFWYRDPGFVCTGLGFNLTNGLQVTWIP